MTQQDATPRAATGQNSHADERLRVLEEYVAKLVAEAPVLSAEQAAAIRRLVLGGKR